MTKTEIKFEIADVTAEIEVIEKQETSDWWTQDEKNRDLDNLRTKRAKLLSELI